MRRDMKSDMAETLALKALAFLLNSPAVRERLTAQSGLDGSTLGPRLEEPEVLGAILDFLLSDDELLVEFCAAESVSAQSVHLARHILGGQ